VPPVLAEMGRDPVCPGLGRHDRCAHRIGMVTAARVPDRRHMVDIDADPERIGAEAVAQAAARLPGFTAGIAARAGGTESAS